MKKFQERRQEFQDLLCLCLLSFIRVSPLHRKCSMEYECNEKLNCIVITDFSKRIEAAEHRLLLYKTVIVYSASVPSVDDASVFPLTKPHGST